MPITSLSFDELDPKYQNFFWAEDRANELMKLHGLLDAGWKFKWDRAQRRLGLCSHKRKVISLSTHFDHIEREEIEDTILHEIAHALVGPRHGHDQVWKRKCIEIGAKPQRLADEHIRTQAKPNYIIRCKNCGNEFTRYRLRPELLTRYHCSICKGKFEAYYAE